jgi:MFS transporter, UMF1 family
MKTKSNIFNWVLYDFANSIVFIVFFLYFSQWIVIEQGLSDLSYNLTFTISAVLLLLTVPLTGTLLDKHWRRITGLRYTTIFSALFFATTAILAINNKPVLALIGFAIALYFYLMAFTFYTPLINDIASEDSRGKVSGWGIAGNYLGQITGLLIVLPFSQGTWNLFSSSARAETLLPATIIFLIFSLPMLIFFKEDAKKRDVEVSGGFINHVKHTIKESKSIISIRSVGFFLLAYLLFNDAIITVANNFGIFLEQVWHVSDTIKTMILLGILLTSAIGGTVSGIIADKYGHKKTLMGILILWAVVFPFIGFINKFSLFIVAAVIMGLAFGANWTVSRSLMGHVAPKGKHNLAFAYFGLAERASSFLGPLVWGLVVSGLVNLGSVRYRIAISVLTFFIFLGIWSLTKVKSDREKTYPAGHSPSVQ